jgi:hypothetical protein
MGFAFENYDAIGRWRDEEKEAAHRRLRQPRARPDLPKPRRTARLLVRDMSDQFVKNLTENLLTYALGRGVEYSDKPTVEEIMRKAYASLRIPLPGPHPGCLRERAVPKDARDTERGAVRSLQQFHHRDAEELVRARFHLVLAADAIDKAIALHEGHHCRVRQ